MRSPEPDFRRLTMNTPGYIWSNVNVNFYGSSDSTVSRWKRHILHKNAISLKSV